MAPARQNQLSISCWPEASICSVVSRLQASQSALRNSANLARSASMSGCSQQVFSVKNAWDQLEEAIRATRHGVFCNARAVAAPISMQRLGAGPGGAGPGENSSGPP